MPKARNTYKQIRFVIEILLNTIHLQDTHQAHDDVLVLHKKSCNSIITHTLLFYVSIHRTPPIRRLTPQPTDRGRADCPSLKGGVTKKDFIGFAVLSTHLFPLKGGGFKPQRNF